MHPNNVGLGDDLASLIVWFLLQDICQESIKKKNALNDFMTIEYINYMVEQ